MSARKKTAQSARFASTLCCPCGGLPAGTPYADCCGRFHNGNALPDSAEHLMRSRYCAYALQNDAWLRATWHPTTRPAEMEAAPQLKWLGLQVLAHHVQDATHAEVEFVARYKENGRAGHLHERSRFVRVRLREDQPLCWLYLDGDLLPVT